MAKKKNKFEALGVNENFVDINEENQQENTQENTKENTKENLPIKKEKNKRFTYRKTVIKRTPESFQIPVPVTRIKAHILMFVCFILALVMRLALDDGMLDGVSGKMGFAASYFAVYAIVFALPCFVYCLIRKRAPGKVFIKGFRVGFMPFIFVSTFLAICLVCLEKYFFAYTFSYVPESGDVNNFGWLFTLLVFCLVPAFFEELLFRGVLQSEYSRFGGGVTGIIICAFLFAIWHFDLPYFLVYFTAGIVLGVITHVTGSVFASIIAHFLNNAFTYFASGWISFVASERIGGTFLMVVLCAFSFVLLMIQLQMTEKICMKKAVAFAGKERESENGLQGEVKDDKVHFLCDEKKTVTRFFKVLLSPEIVVVAIVYTIIVSVS